MSKTSRAIARLQVLADGNVAKEEAHYTHLMVERELGHKICDTEMEKKCQQERVWFEKEMAIFGVDKR